MDTSQQQRRKKFLRQPEAFHHKQISPKSLALIAVIERYRFIPTSQLLRLPGGNLRDNARQLQQLWHRGFIQRFAIPKFRGAGEFIYYIDAKEALNLLIKHDRLKLSPEDQRAREKIIATNREKNYTRLHREPQMISKLPYLTHELMISRFHYMIEAACKKLGDRVQLERWLQGPELWNRVEVPKLDVNDDVGNRQTKMETVDETYFLPHRPDAFFTLHFPGKPEGQSRSHFLYEADRGTENTTRFISKLHTHFQFIVRQRLHRIIPPYQIPSIRAVLTETEKTGWAQQLWHAAQSPMVSNKPSRLFWFAPSELFFADTGPAGKKTPIFLDQPELIFKKIWIPANSTERLDLSQ
jgi:hypothetical protein